MQNASHKQQIRQKYKPNYQQIGLPPHSTLSIRRKTKQNSAQLPWWLRGGKVSVCNAGDLGSIPGLGRYPGERYGNPLQYSCLENPMDRGAWQATVRGVTKSWTTERLTFIGLPFLIIWKFLFQFASQFQNNFYWFHGSFLWLLSHKSINFFYWDIINI